MKLVSTNQANANLINLVYNEDGEVFTGQYEAYDVFQYWSSDIGVDVAEVLIDITDGEISKDKIAEVFSEMVKLNTGTDFVSGVDFESAHIDDFVDMVNAAGGKGYLINASSDYDICIAFLPVSMVDNVFEV